LKKASFRVIISVVDGSYYFGKGALGMQEQDIRYYVLPTIIIFILGIAAMNASSFPFISFLTTTLVAIAIGITIGGAHQLIRLVIKTYQQTKERRVSQKKWQTL
jgi:hypothetical protein